jgi:1-acyl-sn-glycerol-3-phosphate acyltransferase
VRTALELVRRGWNLLLFPEGTRSRTGDVAPFKAGVGVLAKLSGRPVVPVHVSGGQALLPCGAFLPRAATIVVHYGDPLRCGASERTPDFVERLQKCVLDLGGAELATGEAALAAKGLY